MFSSMGRCLTVLAPAVVALLLPAAQAHGQCQSRSGAVPGVGMVRQSPALPQFSLPATQANLATPSPALAQAQLAAAQQQQAAQLQTLRQQQFAARALTQPPQLGAPLNPVTNPNAVSLEQQQLQNAALRASFDQQTQAALLRSRLQAQALLNQNALKQQQELAASTLLWQLQLQGGVIGGGLGGNPVLMGR